MLSAMIVSASGFSGADADIYKLDEGKFAAHLARIAELGPDRVGGV